MMEKFHKHKKNLRSALEKAWCGTRRAKQLDDPNRVTSHAFLRTYSTRKRGASTVKKHQRLTEMKYHRLPPRVAWLILWCLRSAKMLLPQPWETGQLHQHISFPLKKGERGRGVLHFGCGERSPVQDKHEVSSLQSPKSLFFFVAALLFLSR